MTIIAIEGGIGALGIEIAVRLADQLGLALYDAGDLEKRLLTRLNEDRPLNEDSPLPAEPCAWRNDLHLALHVPTSRWCRMISNEVLELAAYDNVVIEGWGAAALLSRYPHTRRVRVTATLEDRLRRLTGLYASASRAQLCQAIESSDAINKFYLNWFGAGVDARTFFNLQVDTSAASVDECVETITSFNPSRRKAAQGYSRAIISALAKIAPSGRA